MDANSRHPMWDLSSTGMLQNTPSIKRGNEIEEMVNDLSLFITMALQHQHTSLAETMKLSQYDHIEEHSSMG